jgi:Bifunctional DNA primase/polymerase, N-terminal/Primase C terminal 1 (PriCT-1)
VPNRAGLAPGIDLRGDGGYVVAPPSRHPNGQRYAWVSNCSPAETTLAPLPRWLLKPAKTYQRDHTLDHWRGLVRDGVCEGQRNSTIASLSGHLLWHRVDPEVVLQLLLAWNRCCCRPPLNDAEVSQVVQSIARLHKNDDRAIGSGVKYPLDGWL